LLEIQLILGELTALSASILHLIWKHWFDASIKGRL